MVADMGKLCPRGVFQDGNCHKYTCLWFDIDYLVAFAQLRLGNHLKNSLKFIDSFSH